MKFPRKLIQSSAVLGILVFFLAGCASPEQRRTAGEYLDDQTINARVKTSLFGDEIVRGRSVSTTTYEGVVQLSGFVDSQTERDRAEELAWQVDGVREVINNIEIKPEPSIEFGEPVERERVAPRRPDEAPLERTPAPEAERGPEEQ